VLALQLNLKAKTVVVLDNYKYDGLEKHYVDYSISEMLEMIESAHYEREARCFVLVHSPKAEYFRKFLFEPLPVESHLNHFLANHLNAEIVAKNVNTTQDSIDWLTWSFMYRRLLNNPNYYNLSEISGQGVNNYLS
jgi:pre-mRNA-splicing helicase BRR2